jgi:hypothetical protein
MTGRAPHARRRGGLVLVRLAEGGLARARHLAVLYGTSAEAQADAFAR